MNRALWYFIRGWRMKTGKKIIKSIFGRLHDPKGSAMLATFMTLLVLGTFSLTIALSKTNKVTRGINHKYRSKSHYIAISGMEFAKYQLNQGVSPDVIQNPFGDGFFEITTDPQNRVVNVTSQAGSIVTEKTFTTDFGADCLDLPTECSSPLIQPYQPGTTYTGGERVHHFDEIFECKPLPFTPLCSDPNFEPGVSENWEDAWTLIGTYFFENCEWPGSPDLPKITIRDTSTTIKNIDVYKTCMDLLYIDKVKLTWLEEEAQPFAEIFEVTNHGIVLFSTYAPFVGTPIENKYVDIEDLEIKDGTLNSINMKVQYPSGEGPITPNEFTVTFELLDGSSVRRSYTYEMGI